MRSKTDWTRIAVAFFTLFVLGFLDNIRGPFFPDIIRDLGLSDSKASFYYIGTSFMTIVAGRLTPWLVRFVSLKWAIKLSHMMMAIGCVGFSMTEGFWSLVGSAIVFGTGFGFINVGQNYLILEGASPQVRRQMFSGLHATYALASLFSPIVVGILASTGHDWRESYQYVIVASLAGFIACFAIREKPEIKVEPPAKKRRGKRGISWEYLPAAAMLSLYVAAELSLCTRFVLYLRRVESMDPSVAPSYLTGFFAMLLLGRLTFAIFPFKSWSNQIIIMTSLLASAVCYLMGLYLSPMWLMVCGLTMAPVFATSLEFLSTHFHEHSDEAIAWVLAASGAFVIAMHFLVGYMTDLFGIHWALHVGPACLIFSAIILARLSRSRQTLGA